MTHVMATADKTGTTPEQMLDACNLIAGKDHSDVDISEVVAQVQRELAEAVSTGKITDTQRQIMLMVMVGDMHYNIAKKLLSQS